MSFYEPVVEWLKEKYGITPVADLDFERGGTDATPYVLKVKKAKADVLLVVTYPPPTSIILRDSYKLGLRIPIISTSGTGVGEQFEKVGIPEANRYFFAPYWFKYPLDHPEMEKFRVMLKKDYPKDKWDVFAPLGVGGAMIVVEALRKVGPDLTREKLITALETFNKFDQWEPIEYPFSTPTTFSPTDHQGFDYVAFSVIDVDTKKFRVLYDWSDYEKLRKK
jgi:branched-chain amino acid transport system substrate-binding protein